MTLVTSNATSTTGFSFSRSFAQRSFLKFFSMVIRFSRTSMMWSALIHWANSSRRQFLVGSSSGSMFNASRKSSSAMLGLLLEGIAIFIRTGSVFRIDESDYKKSKQGVNVDTVCQCPHLVKVGITCLAFSGCGGRLVALRSTLALGSGYSRITPAARTVVALKDT